MPEPLDVGIHDRLVTRWVQREIERLAAEPRFEALTSSEARPYLVRLLAREIERALGALEDSDLALADAVIGSAGSEETLVTPFQRLTGLRDRTDPRTLPEVPIGGFATGTLFAGGRGEPGLDATIRREMASARSVDLICAFVGPEGVRLLGEPIRELTGRGGRLRVLTSTYLGATHRRALDLLAGWGAEIRVVYDRPPVTTKLHAKAWTFERPNGNATALVGSSNLSRAALVDGLEWNVRATESESPGTLASIRATFERYWEDEAFEPYDPDRDGDRLDAALAEARGEDRDGRGSGDALTVFFRPHPWPHQREILEHLQVERKVHGRWRNLVVAATGTGKTVVAALDYERLRSELGADPSLLFVAHREEILDQARTTYRHVLGDGAFGEKWVGGERPVGGRHVFASVQSLARADFDRLAPERFDVVVVDEFHHAVAPTYDRLLRHLRPKCLLGLTATPERTDGTTVADLFEGAPYEIRLWDALDRGLLCPFHYFGVSDNTDLSALRWERGAYLAADLEEVYVTNGDARVHLVATQLREIVADVGRMKALGFCVSVRHARYMAERFTAAGIPSLAVTGETPGDERATALRRLRTGEIRCLFTVDLFNEGVDVPEVDTVLMLRPTESATIFLQQLGRGLRLHGSKTVLTVLDFVGQQHRSFRFDARFRAMTGTPRAGLPKEIEAGFPALPAGCAVRLDHQARETVLRSLRAQIPDTTAWLVAELRELARNDPEYDVASFLRDADLEPSDLYRTGAPGRGFTSLARRAGLVREGASEYEARRGGRLSLLSHVDDPVRLSTWLRWIEGEGSPLAEDEREIRLLAMLAQLLSGPEKRADVEASLAGFWNDRSLRREAGSLLRWAAERIDRLTFPLTSQDHRDVPLRVHATYAKNEIMAAFGLEDPSSMREGVRFFEDHRTDVFVFTLDKAEGRYSPTTRYHDYLVSPTDLRWESQSTTRADSKVGRRYREHDDFESHVLPFVRARESNRYLLLGPAHYVSHAGERPMRVRWRLERPVPESRYGELRAAAG